ncbi:MAG: 50S ribosomal protein L25/general stress protein Ctc [Pseudomonadota bacterium]
MADNLVLDAEQRTRKGKGGARQTRRDGRVPAIIYGGKKPPEMISLVAKEIRREVSTNPRFFSAVCEVKVDGKLELVIPREAQLHPATDDPLHVDFVRVSRGDRVTIEVPVVFRNEDVCPGLKQGGVLNIVRHTVELSCAVESIPADVEVDLSQAQIGDSLHISQVKLPEGVEPVITDRDFTIAGITPPTVVADTEGGDEAEVPGDGERDAPNSETDDRETE